MWLLLGFYGLSMLYGLVVLKMVVGEAGAVVSQDVFWSLGCVSISFEFCVSFAYWLEVFTLVALFPYMLNIINLLEPEDNRQSNWSCSFRPRDRDFTTLLHLSRTNWKVGCGQRRW